MAGWGGEWPRLGAPGQLYPGGEECPLPAPGAAVISARRVVTPRSLLSFPALHHAPSTPPSHSHLVQCRVPHQVPLAPPTFPFPSCCPLSHSHLVRGGVPHQMRDRPDDPRKKSTDPLRQARGRGSTPINGTAAASPPGIDRTRGSPVGTHPHRMGGGKGGRTSGGSGRGSGGVGRASSGGDRCGSGCCCGRLVWCRGCCGCLRADERLARWSGPKRVCALQDE
jgi:hypothetical protein